MNINIFLKLSVVSFSLFALFGCGEEDEAKKLGFSSVAEMREIHAIGWHTKQRHDEDLEKIENMGSKQRLELLEKSAKVDAKKIEKTTKPWHQINIGKMLRILKDDKSAFISWYVENPEVRTSDCLKEEEPSSMISTLKDPTNYGPNEVPKTEVIENEIVNNIPIDITLRHSNHVIGQSSSSLIHVRYIRGKAECKEIFDSLVLPHKIKIQAEIDAAKTAGNKYK